jgi:hypothetical protein
MGHSRNQIRTLGSLMEYTTKRGFKPDLERIKDVVETEFPSEVRQEEQKLLLSYGALKRIEVWIEGKKLAVVTESAPEIGDDLVLDTNKRFRNFLEKATGYMAKQRLQMAKKEVQGKTEKSIDCQLPLDKLFHKVVSSLQPVVNDRVNPGFF